MAVKKKQLTLENALSRLEEITDIMERPDTELNKSLELYREGMGLTIFCAKLLEDVKQEVSVLQKTTEGFIEKVFTSE